MHAIFHDASLSLGNTLFNFFAVWANNHSPLIFLYTKFNAAVSVMR